jgi:hypothetical protein
MDGSAKLLLTPPKAVEFLANHGVRCSAATLASWRTRDPERIPYRKVFGRVYYEAAVLEALVNGETAEAV